ncbi:hypothetical protein KEM54_003082 [Ascosphaera aggregata]|nr:hypothetical protein KEM54_003082 [Ascosphaera aggregata]
MGFLVTSFLLRHPPEHYRELIPDVSTEMHSLHDRSAPDDIQGYRIRNGGCQDGAQAAPGVDDVSEHSVRLTYVGWYYVEHPDRSFTFPISYID